jgi:hypothetical protein
VPRPGSIAVSIDIDDKTRPPLWVKNQLALMPHSMLSSTLHHHLN